jgi:hypothetical protein
MDPDPDPGGTKTFGYDESGFATQENILILSFIHTNEIFISVPNLGP